MDARNLFVFLALLAGGSQAILSDGDHAQRVARAKSILERFADSEAKAILATGELSDEKCSLDYVEQTGNQVAHLVDTHNLWESGDYHLIEDYLMHYLGAQMGLCWPKFSAAIRAAVGALSAEQRTKIEALRRAMSFYGVAKLDLLHYCGQISWVNSDRFQQHLRAYLRGRRVRTNSWLDRLVPGWRPTVEQHLRDVCGQVVAKVLPFTKALAMRYVLESTWQHSGAFEDEWLLKGEICARLLERLDDEGGL